MEGGEGPNQGNPNVVEAKRERTPAETAADLVINATMRYPATDFAASAYIALQCLKKGFEASVLRTALIGDNEQIARIATAANIVHGRAESGKAPTEPLTPTDALILARNDFNNAHDLRTLTQEELEAVIAYQPDMPAGVNVERATLDDMRGRYAKELIQKHKAQE